MHEISSAQNSIFKEAKHLKQKKYREKTGRFLLEGHRYIQTALENGKTCHGVFVLKGMTYEAAGVRVYALSRELHCELVGTENTQGIVGIFDCYPEAQWSDFESQKGNVLFLDGIQDPGNLGTMIRTADAAGFNFIVMNKGTVDVYNDKVIRSAAGSLLNVHCLYVENGVEFLTHLKNNAYHLVVTALENSKDYNLKENYKSKNCLVIGNEANGVSKDIIEMADVVVKIPIAGEAESLNASVAAGIMMYKIKEFEL